MPRDTNDPKIDPSLLSFTNEKPDLRKKEPPLVDVKVTNPIVYIKSWWKKVIGNEGIDIRLRVKPLTAIAISIIIVSLTVGIGRIVFSFKLPFFEYTMKDDTQIAANFTASRDTAFAGVLRLDRLKNRYFLLTDTSEAINLVVPENIDLRKYIGRRILATGKYYENTRSLNVDSAMDLELLPANSETIPTSATTITPEITSP